VNVPAAGDDPVCALYHRYSILKNAVASDTERRMAIRTGLLTRWGEPSSAWARDPDAQELDRLNAGSDELVGAGLDLIDQMMETPATTLAGLAAKLRVSIELCGPRDPDAVEYADIVSTAFMLDAVRLLEGPEARTSMAIRCPAVERPSPPVNDRRRRRCDDMLAHDDGCDSPE